jgi:hypothetical protein
LLDSASAAEAIRIAGIPVERALDNAVGAAIYCPKCMVDVDGPSSTTTPRRRLKYGTSLELERDYVAA